VRRIEQIDLPPDAFSIVMATGVVAVAADDHAYPWLAIPLGWIAVAALIVLAGGLLVKVARVPHTAVGQISDPDVALRLFTSVAACAVLGVRFIDFEWAVWVLGISALAAWLLLVPIAARDVSSRPREDLRDHAHGAWLLASVATAGLATTAADLATMRHSRGLLITGAAFWLLGLVFYLAVAWLLAYRAAAAPIVPEFVTPDSWILMGALAISALAGDHLLRTTQALDDVRAITDWVHPTTFAVWAIATAWIPVLLYAEIWRIDQRTGSLHYADVWWAAVFPLGMYSAATAATARRFDIPALTTVSLVFFWVAFTAWSLVATGLIHMSALRMRRASQTSAADRRPG
jgi:tellurite resistance protein TehA-like permease